VSVARTLEPRRVLVKATNWLGDVVMSLPALRAVRRAYPSASLAVLVKQELAGLYAGFDWVQDVIGYRVRGGLAGIADRRALIADVRAAGFDLAILFPKSFESALWVAAAGVPRRAGLVTQARVR